MLVCSHYASCRYAVRSVFLRSLSSYTQARRRPAASAQAVASLPHPLLPFSLARSLALSRSDPFFLSSSSLAFSCLRLADSLCHVSPTWNFHEVSSATNANNAIKREREGDHARSTTRIITPGIPCVISERARARTYLSPLEIPW